MTADSRLVCIKRIGPDASDCVIAALARLHAAEIEGGFLASLGDGLLASLYRELADSPLATVFAAVSQDEQVVGLICGASSTKAVLKRYLRGRAWRILPRAAQKLLSPRRLFRVMESLFYSMRRPPRDLPEPEILNFCVDRRFQGVGVGQDLFAAIVDDFSARGIKRIRIVTGANQQRAQRFYERAGARRLGDMIIHSGSTSHTYVFEIPARPSRCTAA